MWDVERFYLTIYRISLLPGTADEQGLRRRPKGCSWKKYFIKGERRHGV